MGGGDSLSQDGKIDVSAERGDSNHVEATTTSVPMERKQDM